MDKLEMIQSFRDTAKLSKSEATAVVEIYFNEMTNALANGNRVEIRGLYSFFVKEYGA
jgi:integration host factor subunit beta